MLPSVPRCFSPWIGDGCVGLGSVESRVPALPVSQQWFSPWEPAPSTVSALSLHGPAAGWGPDLGRAAVPHAQAQAWGREGLGEEQLKSIPVYPTSFPCSVLLSKGTKGREGRVWCRLEHLQGGSTACGVRSAFWFWGPGSQRTHNFSDTNCLILSTDCLAVCFLPPELCYSAWEKQGDLSSL